MRRQRTSEESSLDLLLDTICNMFGLIIFVAILAAVIASVRSRHTAEAVSPEAQPRSSEVATTALDQGDPLSDLIASREAQLDRLQQEIERRRGLLDDLESPEVTTVQPVDLDTIRMQTRTLQQDLQRMTELRDVTLRTPQRRALAGRLPVQVVLAEDRLWVLNDWSGWHGSGDPIGDRCRFWTTWNADVVDLEQPIDVQIHQGCEFRTGTQDIERRVTLRDRGGVEIDDSWPSRSRIAETLAMLDPDRHVISMRVAEDSHEGFQWFRNAVVQAGFPYDVTPWVMPQDRQYHDRIRQGTATAQ